MEVLEAIMSRRSIRKYKPDKIPRSLIDKVIDAARWAPSGGNTQPWRFVIVTDETLKKMLRTVAPGLSGEPSVIIVSCVNHGVVEDETVAVKILDLGAAIQNILLASHALGLGTCWIGSANWKGVREIVGIPEDSRIEPISLISIGFPSERTPPRERLSIDEIAYHDTFGSTWTTYRGSE